MKRFSLFAVVATLGAGSVAACPWSGGSYEGKDFGLEINFSVNEACSEITMQSSGNAGFQPIDEPQTFPMMQKGKEWKADINGAEMSLSESGDWVLFLANGNDTRVDVRPAE